MPRPSSLQLSKDLIVRTFDQAVQKVFSESQLRRLLDERGPSWGVVPSTTLSDLIGFLTRHGQLKKHVLRVPEYSRTVTRYAWGKPSPFELAHSIAPRGYLCHETALMLHGLIAPKPRTLYLNIEQSAKPASGSSLTQDAINRAFANKQRQSNMVYVGSGLSVVIISGKNTNRLGVKDIEGPSSEALRTTDLERTLIDIVVRPGYAGGPSGVLQAYRAAKGRVSVESVLTTLRKLDYAYPYHQSIGFLMERAGYPPSDYEQLRSLGLAYDFYLAYGIEKREFSPAWRIFYPRGL